MTKKNTHRVNIYQLNGIKDTNKGCIKNVGYIYSDSQYDDEEIFFDKKKQITTKEIMDCVFIKMYKCRMTDEYVAKHKKLPLMYTSIYYQKKFITGYLFSVYVYFEITSDTSKIKTINSLLNTELNGKYSIEIVMDEKCEVINMKQFDGYDKVIDNMVNIINTDEMKDIIKRELNKRDSERKEQMGNIIENKPNEPKYNFTELLNEYEKGNNIDDVLKKIF